MAALDFPDNPATGDLYGSAGTVWRWDGARWASTAGASGARGRLAYSARTVNATGFPAVAADIGIAVTWVADPSRVYRTTMQGTMYADNANAVMVAQITDGSGVEKANSGTPLAAVGYGQGFHVVAIESGLSGSQTRKGRAVCPILPNGNIGASVQNPCWIMVEDITYEAGSPGSSGLPDVRTRWTRSTGYAYPGHNAPILWENNVYQSGLPIDAGANFFTMPRDGIYTVSYMVNWGASSVPQVCATWIQEVNVNRRHMSSQVNPTANVAGWTTGGSSTMRLAAGEKIAVDVYNPSTSPPGIAAAEIEITLVAQ